MDRKEKQAKKAFISGAIDLANGRFKDDEVDSLYDLVENREKYDGASKTYKDRYDGWSSDGRYTRKEETTYTFHGDESGVRIDEHYEYYDDDGQSGSIDRVLSTGREILNALDKVFGK